MSKRSRRFLGAILVLLLLMFAGYFVGWEWGQARGRGQESDASTEVTPPANSRARTSAGNAREAPAGGAPAVNAIHDKTPPGQSPVDESAPTEPLTEVLRFCFQEGAEVVFNIRFRYCLVTQAEFIADFQAETLIETEFAPEPYRLVGQTDVNGNFDVPREILRTVGAAVRGFRIAFDQPGWQFASLGDWPGATKRTMEYATCVAVGKIDFGIPVFKCNPTFFNIHYEDGGMFSGEVTVSLNIARGQSKFFRRTLKEGELLQVEAPRVFVKIAVNAMGNRRGFEFNRQQCYSPQELKPTQELVILRDTKQNTLLVHLGKWPTGEQVAITYRSRDDHSWLAGNAIGGETWETYRVVRNDCFFVEVSGPSGLWRSEMIRTGENEQIDVYPEPTQPVTYVVRFVDGAGKAAVPAVLSSQLDSYADWWLVKKQSVDEGDGCGERLFARAGSTGVARLSQIMPGKRVIVAEAYGYEPVKYEVNAKPGETVDLGVVPLVLSKGRIEVVLLGAKSGVGYYVWLRGPESRGIVDVAQNVTSGSVVFEKVAVREYSLHVAGSNGGVGRNVAISFPSGSSELRVEIDVSDLAVPANE